MLAEGLHGPARFQGSSRLVLVPVTVTDERGTPVPGLASKTFTVLESNRPQRILSFSEEDSPCSIGLVFDLSGSMETKANLGRAALRALLDSAEPADEALLLTVAGRPAMERGFTRDLESLFNGMMMRRTGGGTALVDTIYLGLDQMRAARHRRKALLVISDGMDNHSRFTASELMSTAMESDIEIHTIGVETMAVNAKAAELNQISQGLSFLASLAQKTGGLNYVVRGETDIRRASGNIGKALRNHYVLGYQPGPLEPNGQWRPIQVRLNVPRWHAHTRSGYYAR